MFNELQIRQDIRIGDRLRRRKDNKRITKAVRLKILNHFENKCALCSSASKLSIDHHIPFSLGGELKPGNIVVLCKPCNSSKRDQHPNIFYNDSDLSRINLLASSLTY